MGFSVPAIQKSSSPAATVGEGRNGSIQHGSTIGTGMVSSSCHNVICPGGCCSTALSCSSSPLAVAYRNLVCNQLGRLTRR